MTASIGVPGLPVRLADLRTKLDSGRFMPVTVRWQPSLNEAADTVTVLMYPVRVTVIGNDLTLRLASRPYGLSAMHISLRLYGVGPDSFAPAGAGFIDTDLS